MPSSSAVNGPSRPAALGLAGHLGEQGAPAAEQVADCRAKLGVRPAGGDQLLQDPHIAESRSSSR